MRSFLPLLNGRCLSPPVGKIQAGYLRGLKSLALREGVDLKAMLDSHRVELSSFEDEQYFISCESASELLEDCSFHLNDPLFGIRLAQHQAPNVFGCVSVLARSSADLRQALEALVKYVPLVNSPEGYVELVTTNEIAEFRWNTMSGFGYGRQVELHGLQILMKILRDLGGAKFNPISASLPCYVPDPDRDGLEAALGCKFVGRASRKSITFPVSLLDLPLEWSDEIVRELLTDYLDRAFAQVDASLKDRVDALIRSTLAGGGCSIERCAERLDLSVRTLQKHLARQGLSFSELVENQREHLAKLALSQGNVSLDDIAFALGYAEQTSFGRAFKRWTGLAPDGFRRAARASTISRPQ